MNDPNGLVWYKGKYHAFFQHYPYAPRWGQMHWGHATSTDLIHWEEHDIALFPDKDYENDGGCFSGSAIVKDDRLYLFYTSVSHELGQTQSMAYSDDGFTFIKYEGNPIIPRSPLGDNKDFRDPKVFRYEDEYRMIVGAGIYNIAKLLLFKSTDLINWEYIGELMSDGRFGGVAECPDLFQLDDKWVLIFSSVKALPHRVCFALGEFDGTTFEPDMPMKEVHGQKVPSDDPYFPVETGPDFYAPQTFEDSDGRRILIAWMYNWSRKSPSGQTHVGAFTIPRQIELSVRDELLMFPVEEACGLLKKESPFVFYERGLLKVVYENKTILERPFAEEPELQILEDVGVVEIFINGGREVITTYIC
ncbi:MAG: glycoside hydrolase family 32 protein [Saccharofermentans sp.]|nr:glycoside hydrolase family 32 protein [Saccharofermentans sp.]